MLLTRKADESGFEWGERERGPEVEEGVKRVEGRFAVGVGGNHVMRHANMAKTLAKRTASLATCRMPLPASLSRCLSFIFFYFLVKFAFSRRGKGKGGGENRIVRIEC